MIVNPTITRNLLLQQTGKKEEGLSVITTRNFACLLSAEGGRGWESVSAIPAPAGRQNRKIFFSLIEKDFGRVQLKNVKKIFLFCSAVRRAETLGGIQSAKSSGFCSKKVLTSSNKHHQRRLAASPAAEGEGETANSIWWSLYQKVRTYFQQNPE
jgi:hypothetical protein